MFSGVVSGVAGTVPEGLADGTPFTGSLAYDPDADENPFQWLFELSEAGARLRLDIDGIAFEGDWSSDARGGRRLLRVAVLGSRSFDISDIDPGTLAFGPAGAAPFHRKGGHRQDVNRDRFPDLVSHYRLADSGLSPGDARACVTGATYGGTAFEGCIDLAACP